MDIEALTNEEIQTLQVDEMLRKLGYIEQAITIIDFELIQATQAFYTAKQNLDNLKNKKNSLIERARILKTIVSNA